MSGSKEHIKLEAALRAASNEDRTLFEKVRAAIGHTATYVGREILGDIKAKLIDEAWFGRAPDPSHDHRSISPGDFWRGSSHLTIEGELTRSDREPAAPDRSPER